jgi:toxin HigB-1
LIWKFFKSGKERSCAGYYWKVILGYRDRRTKDFAFEKRVKAFAGFERSARLKLDGLEAATLLGGLAALPGNRFEALIGDRKGQYSIRINDQWRVCFEWDGRSPEPSNVEIVDYHWENCYGTCYYPSR